MVSRIKVPEKALFADESGIRDNELLYRLLMKPTTKKRTQRETAPSKRRDRDLQSQLAKGREFMKKYADTFRALAK